MCRDIETFEDGPMDLQLACVNYVDLPSEQNFFWGFDGTQYRIRLYPPFGV